MLRNVPSVARKVAQGYMKVQGDYLEVFRSSIEVYDGKTYFNYKFRIDFMTISSLIYRSEVP